MNDINGTPNLNKALAAFQAEAPQITKDQKGVIPGKDGKRGYEYSYADLAGVCAAALPLLGKHGLAFFAKPVITGNQFGMVCKLKHASGEEEEGFYPLPSQATPQQIGSVITYGRRYSMLMMTGLAPGGDDDAAAGNTTHQYAPQSAGEAFENATPAPRRQPNGNGHANGNVTRPPAREAPTATGEPDEDAQPYADEAHDARTVEALSAVNVKARDAHKLAALIRSPVTGNTGGLGQFINWKRGVLQKAEKSLDVLRKAGAQAGMDDSELDREVKELTGHGIEDATAEEMDKAAKSIADALMATAGRGSDPA